MQLAVSRLPGGSRAVVGQVVAQVAGGSYRERSFLRAALVDGAREGQVAALLLEDIIQCQFDLKHYL